MEEIKLKNVIPEIFVTETPDHLSLSELWQRSEVAFRRGARYLIRAESGTGKSSLCNFLFGNRTDYKGTITFDATDIRTYTMSQWTALRRDTLSWLPQELALFPELTVRQNIDIKNRLTRFRSDQWIEQSLERLEIADRSNTLVAHCSVGQQQRVALIRALCQPFSFLLLDEPVSHLDERRTAEVAALVGEEVSSQGAGLIVTSVGIDLPLDSVEILRL